MIVIGECVCENGYECGYEYVRKGGCGCGYGIGQGCVCDCECDYGFDCGCERESEVGLCVNEFV